MFGPNALCAGLGILLAATDLTAPPPSQAPPSGQIRGSVSYGRHAGAAGAIVVVRPENGISPLYAATTGANGAFAFDRIPDGMYRAEVRRDGYIPVVKSGVRVRAPFRAIFEAILAKGPAPREVPITPEGTASVSGTVRVVGGAPMAEAHVTLARPDGAADSRAAVTNAAGAFALSDVRAGRWRLDVKGAGFLSLRFDLDVAADVVIEAQIAAQPAEYRPSPQDLLVPEDVVPPPGP